MNRLPWEITREMFLSEDEVGGLVAHLERAVESADERQRPSARLDELIVKILLYSGLRTSELCRLAVRDTIVGSGRSVLRVHGSGGGEDRTVHIPDAVSRLITDFHATVRSMFLPPDVSPGDHGQPLLFSERRRPYQRTGLYRRVRRILTDAGLGDRASVQLLRHTYGYLAYRNTGGNLLFVQRQLGHAHPMITSVYATLVDESYEALAERVYGFQADNKT